MRVDVHLKHLERNEFINNILDKNIKKVKRQIKIFSCDDPVHISVYLEKNSHREEYFCRAHIYLPSKVINVRGKASTFSLAVNRVFSALSKQLDKFKHRRERHLRKKHTQR